MVACSNTVLQPFDNIVATQQNALHLRGVNVKKGSQTLPEVQMTTYRLNEHTIDTQLTHLTFQMYVVTGYFSVHKAERTDLFMESMSITDATFIMTEILYVNNRFNICHD